ncbi:MAG: hypothetical protein HN353_12905 [Bdellovibrionales bacterium]|jgi:uncharacterized protein involved in exopolysaccharide biosynthesis|nr:hypothetical protein [Bdellovibrionales bacterium]MBT3525308.1 hypothetical protein [Bdellovibrionales bacterium]MBT7668545.1 hypothetical protein [Bdellovibrionales bacterium]MBT7766150.1 hypothetical protein [Bdellovibrionales bacterium]
MESDQISLNDILQVFLRRWKILIILALLFVLGALVKHKFFPVYPAHGIILIKSPYNSQYHNLLKSITSEIGEFARDQSGSNQDVAKQAVVFLETTSFYRQLALDINDYYYAHPNDQHYIDSRFKKYFKLSDHEKRIESLTSILRWVYNFKTFSDGQIRISLKTKNRHLSLILINTILKKAKEVITKRELADIGQAERYFELEIKSIKEKLDKIEAEIILKMQDKKMLSVDIEKGESSRYLTQLRKNIHDIEITLNENKRALRQLKAKFKKGHQRVLTNKFSKEAQSRNIEEENRTLISKLKTYKSYLKAYGKKQRSLLPFQHEIDTLRSNYAFEYKIYESFRKSMSKLGLQKTYILNKVEILEPEYLSHIHSSPQLLTMIFMAMMISQVLGMGMIYTYELFRVR